jgi:4-aminobutyrate aminotransferase-like enzyme
LINLLTHFFEILHYLIDKLILEGVFTDWFLFAAHALRIAPPLNISNDEIDMACNKILQVLQEV